jgi:AraC-like DNA-binding protein
MKNFVFFLKIRQYLSNILLMISNPLTNFFIKFKKYLFTYKDDYFELPYLGNSPYSLIETMGKMPFIKHIKEHNTLEINNLFCKGKLHYAEIEPDFVLMTTSNTYKKKITFNIQYDPSLQSDYYVISFVQNLRKVKSNDTNLNGFEYKNSSWSIAKPNSLQRSYHEKDSEYFYLSFYIRTQWIEANIQQDAFTTFRNSNQTFLFFADLVSNANDSYLSLYNLLVNNNENGKLDKLLLKTESYQFINTFLQKLLQFYNLKTISTFKDEDIKKIAAAEIFLIEQLFKKFPGIECIAAKVGMSATKLKTSFKQYYGQTLFDYYNAKQLNYAKQLLEQQNKNIKEIAFMLGYNNTSKFTAAFKKYHDILPSTFINSKFKKP